MYTGRRACVRAFMRMYMYVFNHDLHLLPALGITLGISLHLLIAYLRQKVQGRSFVRNIQSEDLYKENWFQRIGRIPA